MDREIVKEEETYEFYREQTLLLTEEYKELKQRIDKAIEYIESEVVACAFNNPELEHWEFDDYNMRKLLAILKGEDK